VHSLVPFSTTNANIKVIFIFIFFNNYVWLWLEWLPNRVETDIPAA